MWCFSFITDMKQKASQQVMKYLSKLQRIMCGFKKPFITKCVIFHIYGETSPAHNGIFI